MENYVQKMKFFKNEMGCVRMEMECLENALECFEKEMRNLKQSDANKEEKRKIEARPFKKQIKDSCE